MKNQSTVAASLAPQRAQSLAPQRAQLSERAPQLRMSLPDFDPAWALFLDFDGTLVDIAPAPDQVQLSPRVKAALDVRARDLCGALAIISGRTIAELDAFFVPARISAAGVHGAEMRLPDDSTIRHSNNNATAVHAACRVAADRLRVVVSAHPGLMLEEKQLGVTLHFRAAPHEAAFCWQAAHHAVKDLDVLDVCTGKMVVEIVDRTTDKGTALAAFMRHPAFRGRIPVFIGDDDADEVAISMAQDLGGVGIRIMDADAPMPTCADFCVSEPEVIRRWLTDV